MLKPIYLGPMNRPGDDVYTMNAMFPAVYFERETLFYLGEKDLEIKKNKSREKEKADFLRSFTIANKAEGVSTFGKPLDAERMCYHSIKINPRAFDAQRVLILSHSKLIDYDTIICSLREQLCVMRSAFKTNFQRKSGNFNDTVETHPYLRALEAIAKTSLIYKQLDIQTFALEEMIRLDHSDFLRARDPLLSCYLQILGKQQRGIEVYPKRSIEDVEQFMYQSFGYDFEDSLFTDSPCEYMFRFAQVVIAYAKGKEEWKTMLKNLEKDNKSMFKSIFEEVEDSPQCADQLLLPNAEESPEISVARLQFYFKNAAYQWPDFIVEARNILRETKDSIFQKIVESKINDDKPQSEEYLLRTKETAQTNLDLGRDGLRKRSFKQALTSFSLAKTAYTDAARNPKRWYTAPDVPFAVATNRSTAAAQLSMWDIARIDARYSLAMKPDHIKTYERLPDIASGFYCPQIRKELEELLDDVKANPEKTQEEWKEFANRGIALISLDTLISSRLDYFTLQYKKGVIDRGIDDLYTTINYPDYPTLPWVHGDFFEKEM